LAVLSCLFAALALGVAACGDDDDEGGGGDTGAATSGEVKQGGTAKIYYTSFPDYMDPALSYTVEGWSSLWLVYTPLLAYPHEEGANGAKLIPGLAEALPEISEDGKTYTLKLREGLKYSDGTEVKASDFERTIQRVLNLESGGSAFYLGIEGAEEYVEKGEAEADIPGIEGDDSTGEITIKLKEADGSFSYVLAMNFAALVPGDTPFRNLTKNPPPGVGPYKISESNPPRSFSMEKNTEFNIPGIPKGNMDGFDVTVVKNQQRQVQDLIAGKADYLIDPPPADQIGQVRSQYKDRYKEFVANSTYYLFLNQREKPFDDAEVRKAVHTGLDKGALARIFGGLLEPACNFLPPGMIGYEKVDPCPYGDPKQKPDLEKARQMIKDAGAEGAEVTVYGNDEDPSKPVTENVADQLNQMGFKAEPKIVEGSVYFTTIGNQKTKAQAGYANWFQDFPHPSNFMFLVDGASIQDTNNQNFGNVDDPEINEGIARLKKESDLESVAGEWAALDKKLVEEGLVVPYGHRKLTVFMSERMNFENCSVVHPLYYGDWSSFCLK